MNRTAPATAAGASKALTLYNPRCSCCEEYAKYLRANGFEVKVLPVSSLNKLLTERPAIKGISLPGMPLGSPGMGGRKQEPSRSTRSARPSRRSSQRSSAMMGGMMDGGMMWGMGLFGLLLLVVLVLVAAALIKYLFRG